jgi:hypothetical protein
MIAESFFANRFCAQPTDTATRPQTAPGDAQ